MEKIEQEIASIEKEISMLVRMRIKPKKVESLKIRLEKLKLKLNGKNQS